jgi:hypothetical protein
MIMSFVIFINTSLAGAGYTAQASKITGLHFDKSQLEKANSSLIAKLNMIKKLERKKKKKTSLAKAYPKYVQKIKKASLKTKRKLRTLHRLSLKGKEKRAQRLYNKYFHSSLKLDLAKVTETFSNVIFIEEQLQNISNNEIETLKYLEDLKVQSITYLDFLDLLSSELLTKSIETNKSFWGTLGGSVFIIIVIALEVYSYTSPMAYLIVTGIGTVFGLVFLLAIVRSNP